MNIGESVIKVITTSPVKDFLISCAASMSWDGIKTLVSGHQKKSVERLTWNLISDTMLQFYNQMSTEFGKVLEFEEEIIMTSFVKEFAEYDGTVNENTLRDIVEKSIYGEIETLTDKEFELWVSIFADKCMQYPELYQMYRIQRDISKNIFTERNLMFQRIIAKLNIFVGNEENIEDNFKFINDNICQIFKSSWKDSIVKLLNKLQTETWMQEAIDEKMRLVYSNENCELVLETLEEIFNIHDFTKASKDLLIKIQEEFKYPHFNKVFIVTGPTGSGKTFFLKSFIKAIIPRLENGDRTIIPCIINILKLDEVRRLEQFILEELNSFVKMDFQTVDDANCFFKDIKSRVCFVIDDLNTQILKKEDWNELIQIIKLYSQYEQFRWILSVDEYEYYYLEWDDSFLDKYCIAQNETTKSDKSIFNNTFSVNQYNKENHIVEWLLESKYGLVIEDFSWNTIENIMTPQEAHYFGEIVPGEEMIALPSTYYEYINKIVKWKNDELIYQNKEENILVLQKILEFIVTERTCKLDGLYLTTNEVLPFRKVYLISPVFTKSHNMFNLEQNIVKTSYRIKIFPFWAAKMTHMIDINDSGYLGGLSRFPKKLAEWLIPCIIFYNFESDVKKDESILHFFEVLNENLILDYALFCANKASVEFSKKLYEYLIENVKRCIRGAKECYSILYYIYYSRLKSAEKLRLLNLIAEYIVEYGFESMYERIYCSIIYTLQKESKLKKNLSEVACGQVEDINYINGSKAANWYMKLAEAQEKSIETIVWDIIEYIEADRQRVSSVNIENSQNGSCMDFFIRRCFEKYLSKNSESLGYVYQQLEPVFELERPLGGFVKRNLTCAAGNVFINYSDESYKKNYISLIYAFMDGGSWYEYLTAFFLIANGADEENRILDKRLKALLIEMSQNKQFYRKYRKQIEELVNLKNDFEDYPEIKEI